MPISIFQSLKSKIYLLIITALLIIIGYLLFTKQKHHELISLFPIQNYDQNISHWIKSSDSDYDKPLLTPEQQNIRKQELYKRYFGEHSPWSPEYINQVFSKEPSENLAVAEQVKVNWFNNKNKASDEIQFGSNYIPHTQQWIQKIETNMNLQQFNGKHYEVLNRAIAVNNMQGRVLPTNDVSFNDPKLAGQGYPFDNLQAATVWAGTPLYILGTTLDKSWSLVQTPNFIAWIESSDLAIADEKFVKEWTEQAQQNLAAMTQTRFSIIDTETDAYRFSGFIGMLFPAIIHDNGIRITIPVADSNRRAKMYHAQLTHQQAVIFPWQPTPHHFSELISQLIDRPYGWGGMYLHSDCSAELKNLFVTFGILLPAHSSTQVDPERYIVKQVDLSKSNIDERLNYLKTKGHKFMTIVYVGGHVFLYLGNYSSPTNPKEKVILTYQSMWGLKPGNEDTRVVIGKTVLFPLIKSYPENTQLHSQASKAYFQLGYLDPSPQEMIHRNHIDLASSVSP